MVNYPLSHLSPSSSPARPAVAAKPVETKPEPSLINRYLSYVFDPDPTLSAWERMKRIAAGAAPGGIGLAAVFAPTAATAANALKEMGAAAVPALSNALKHENKKVRSRAIGALQDIGDTSALPALTETKEHDPDHDLRLGAKFAIESIQRRNR